MRWALNSSRPAVASELGAVLRAEIVQFEKTLDLRLAKNKVAAMEAEARGQSPEPEQDSPTMRNASHGRVVEQMIAGITAASAMAAALGNESTQFLATITGHFDPNDDDGIEERMAVFVDTVPERRRDDA